MSRRDHPRPPAAHHVVHQTDIARYETLLRLRDEGLGTCAIAREMGIATGSVRQMIDRVENRVCSGVMVRLDDGSLRWSNEYAAAAAAGAKGAGGVKRRRDGKIDGYSDRGVSDVFDLPRARRALDLAAAGASYRSIARDLGVTAERASKIVRATRFYLGRGWLAILEDGSLAVADGAPRVLTGVANSGRGYTSPGRKGQKAGAMFPPPIAPPPGARVDLRLAERALAARKEGLTWKEVGQRLGAGSGSLHRLCAWAVHLAGGEGRYYGADSPSQCFRAEVPPTAGKLYVRLRRALPGGG